MAEQGGSGVGSWHGKVLKLFASRWELELLSEMIIPSPGLSEVGLAE